MSTSRHKTSIVVLNWNGGQMLLSCLASALKQDAEDFEVLLVDNASTDTSVSAAVEAFPDLRLLKLETNLGFAGGMNAGIAAANAEFVCLLNFDIELERDYVRKCVDALERDKLLGGVNGKLFKTTPGDLIIDTTGHTFFRNRWVVDRGEWEKDSDRYDMQRSLFSINGAAPCYRYQMLTDIQEGDEFFDEDFFAYFEDVDLCWRAQLRAWRFAYVPCAVGRHHRGATGAKSSTEILAYNHRNRLLMIVKNDHPMSFLKHIFGIVYVELRASTYMLMTRPKAFFLGWLQTFALLPKMLHKRKVIQARRTVGWRDLEPMFTPFPYRDSARKALARLKVLWR